MLVFFIHGVNTQDANYAKKLIKNIKSYKNEIKFGFESFLKYKNEYQVQYPLIQANFYSGFWGDLFNNKKNQTISYIENDFALACQSDKEFYLSSKKEDIYRYIPDRTKLINEFLGDFLIYQNHQRGAIIRERLFRQLDKFFLDHPHEKEIHFVAHSLGSIILWDLIFSDHLLDDDPAYLFRNKLKNHNLCSITTMGSPLLFFKQMMDWDFSRINHWLKDSSSMNSNYIDKLRWVNIIHSSDMMAYPLKSAVKNEINSDILFFDQYVWQDANVAEKGLRTIGQEQLAMVTGVTDAHTSYFENNISGSITSRIIGYNLLGETEKLFDRCVISK